MKKKSEGKRGDALNGKIFFVKISVPYINKEKVARFVDAETSEVLWETSKIKDIIKNDDIYTTIITKNSKYELIKLDALIPTSDSYIGLIKEDNNNIYDIDIDDAINNGIDPAAKPIIESVKDGRHEKHVCVFDHNITEDEFIDFCKLSGWKIGEEEPGELFKAFGHWGSVISGKDNIWSYEWKILSSDNVKN
jgi:hypothetical protein